MPSKIFSEHILWFWDSEDYIFDDNHKLNMDEFFE